MYPETKKALKTSFLKKALKRKTLDELGLKWKITYNEENTIITIDQESINQWYRNIKRSKA